MHRIDDSVGAIGVTGYVQIEYNDGSEGLYTAEADQALLQILFREVAPEAEDPALVEAARPVFTPDLDAARKALGTLLWELPAEFTNDSPPESSDDCRSEFRVIKQSNVHRVHESLWELQQALGWSTSDYREPVDDGLVDFAEVSYSDDFSVVDGGVLVAPEEYHARLVQNLVSIVRNKAKDILEGEGSSYTPTESPGFPF